MKNVVCWKQTRVHDVSLCDSETLKVTASLGSVPSLNEYEQREEEGGRFRLEKRKDFKSFWSDKNHSAKAKN